MWSSPPFLEPRQQACCRDRVVAGRLHLGFANSLGEQRPRRFAAAELILLFIVSFIFSTRSQGRARSDELMTSNQRQRGTPEIPKETADGKRKEDESSRSLLFIFRPNPDGRPLGHGRISKEESTHVRAIDLNRQALIVKRKKAARYFRFSSCFEFITSSNLSHFGPCCVLGHFQLSKNNDAFSAVLSRPNI